MVTLRALVLGMVLPSAATAQQMQMHDCRELLANLERFTGAEAGQVKPVARLDRTLRRLFSGSRLVMGIANGGTGIVLAANGDQAATVSGMFAELRRPDLQELRVQCTFVSMPLKTAAGCGLVAGQPMPVDEGQAGKVLKEAVAAKGTLRNLPETGGVPLQAFVVEHAQDTRRMRIEALPLAEDEAWFTMQLVDGKLPADRTLLPDRKLFDVGVRLKVGGGVLVMAQQGEQATVVWVRFTGTRKAEELPEGVPADKGGEPARPGK